MDFIKKFFDEFKAFEKPPEGKVTYAVTDWGTPNRFWKFTESVPEDSYFTTAEKNYLQRLLAERINEQEDMRQEILYEAKNSKKHHQDVYSKKMFKFHRAIKADIKKLVALQRKVKHTLTTRG